MEQNEIRVSLVEKRDYCLIYCSSTLETGRANFGTRGCTYPYVEEGSSSYVEESESFRHHSTKTIID